MFAETAGGKHRKEIENENKILCNTLKTQQVCSNDIKLANDYVSTLRSLGVMVHGKGSG